MSYVGQYVGTYVSKCSENGTRTLDKAEAQGEGRGREGAQIPPAQPGGRQGGGAPPPALKPVDNSQASCPQAATPPP